MFVRNVAVRSGEDHGADPTAVIIEKRQAVESNSTRQTADTPSEEDQAAMKAEHKTKFGDDAPKKCQSHGAKSGMITENAFGEMCQAEKRDYLPKFDNDAEFFVDVHTGPIQPIKEFYEKSETVLKILKKFTPAPFQSVFYFQGTTASKNAKVEKNGSDEEITLKEALAFSIGYFLVEETLLKKKLWPFFSGGKGAVSWSPDPCSIPKLNIGTHTISRVGSVTGKQLNVWLEWVAGFASKHKWYSTFSVVKRSVGSSGSTEDKILPSMQSGDFLELGLEQLWHAGANIDREKRLCKPEFILFTTSTPDKKIVPVGDHADGMDKVFERILDPVMELANETGGVKKLFQEVWVVMQAAVMRTIPALSMARCPRLSSLIKLAKFLDAPKSLIATLLDPTKKTSARTTEISGIENAFRNIVLPVKNGEGKPAITGNSCEMKAKEVWQGFFETMSSSNTEKFRAEQVCPWASKTTTEST